MELKSSPFPPELNFLCSVSRPKLDHLPAETMLHEGLKWPLLLNLARAHGVRPQLIGTLSALDWKGVPSEARRSLMEFARLHKARSLFFADQLLEVADKFAERTIRFATFKGPSLAATLYGDLSRREYNDIDLIVDKERIKEAQAALAPLGYRPVYPSSAFRDAFLSYQRQSALVREDHLLAIDLHWAFTSTQVPFPVTPAEIWRNLDNIQLGGQSIPTLGQGDLALFLAGHGTKEGWRCLGWVCDFAMLIEKHPDLDWCDLLGRARQKRCGRTLLLDCQLAAQLLGTRVEGVLLKLAENDSRSRLGAEKLVQRIGDEFPASSSERTFGELELCETRAQRGKILTRLLITRTVGDYDSMPLPSYLWRAYHVTRPFRLIAKAVRGLFTRGL